MKLKENRNRQDLKQSTKHKHDEPQKLTSSSIQINIRQFEGFSNLQVSLPHHPNVEQVNQHHQEQLQKVHDLQLKQIDDARDVSNDQWAYWLFPDKK